MSREQNQRLVEAYERIVEVTSGRSAKDDLGFAVAQLNSALLQMKKNKISGQDKVRKAKKMIEEVIKTMD